MTEKITEFREAATEYDSTKSLDSKIRRNKMLKAYKRIGCLILLVLVAGLLFINWRNQIFSQYEVKQENEWNKVDSSTLIVLKNNMIVYSNNGISSIDNKGKALWNQTYEMQKPMVVTCNNVVAVADYNGRNIYVASTDKILGSFETTMPIRDICVSASGVVAAVLDDSNVTAIYLYDPEGNEIAYFKTTMSKSGYPIAIAISDDSKQVAVSYVNAKNGEVTSNIGFYNFSAVGQNYTDNLVGAWGYTDSIVPYMTFMGNSTSVAVADNRVMFFEGKEIPHNLSDTFITEPIQGIYNNKDHIGLVFYNTSGEDTYKMDLYNTKGEKEQTINFSLQYDDIVFNDSGIIIYNKTNCEVFTWKGVKKYEGIFEKLVDCVIPGNRIDRYTLVSGNTIQTINLK